MKKSYFTSFIVVVFAVILLVACLENRSKGTGLNRTELTPIPGYSTERLLKAMTETSHASQSASGSMSNLYWESRGPNHTGGRIRTGMFDPNDPAARRFFAGAISGGLWYTDDITSADSCWYPVDDMFPNLAISAIAYDPTQTQKWFLGTGEGFENGNAVVGVGIFKSTDGGVSWQHLSSTGNSNFQYVNKLRVTSAGTLLAATSGNQGGLFRSIDEGVIWTQMKSGKYSDISIAGNGDIYAARGIYNSTAVLFKSTDDGLTWVNVTPSGMGNGRAIVSTSASNSNIVYTAVAPATAFGDGKVYKSENGGSSWTLLTAPMYNDDKCSAPQANFASGIGWHSLMLTIHPQNADQVILGGFEAFRSLDGGSSWQQETHWRGICHPFVHADHLLALHRPGYPDEVVMLNDGGVFYSPNFGDGLNTSPDFIERNEGLIITQFNRVGFDDRADVDFFIGGSQDNSVLILDAPGVSANRQVFMTDGNFCHIDTTDHDFIVASFARNLVYKSFDRGKTFKKSQVAGQAPTPEFYPFSFYDREKEIFYLAGSAGKINRMKDFKLIEQQSEVSLGISGFITFMKPSPYTTDRFFVGTSTGNIYRIDHLSQIPVVVDITGNISVSERISGIDIEGSDDELIATLFGYGVTSIWQTQNAGALWSSRQGDLPDLPVRSVMFHPFDNSRAMITTELGVWATDNLSSSTLWYPINKGMANVRTDEIQYRASDSLLILTTHGRGVFSSDFLRVPVTAVPEIMFLAGSKTIREESFDSLRNYRDQSFLVHITKPPSGEAIVDLGFAGTATFGVDYDLVSPDSLVFDASLSQPQKITLRIFNDRAIESTEEIVITLSQRTSATDAILHAYRHTLRVAVEDRGSDLYETDEVIYFQNWDPASAADFDRWNATFGSYNFWDISSSCSGPTQMLNVINFFSCGYSGNGTGTNMIVYDTIDATGYRDVKIRYDWRFSGNADDYVEVIFSEDGINWSAIGSKRFGVSTFTSDTVSLPEASENKEFYVGFRFIENGDANIDNSVAFSMDNFTVLGTKRLLASTELLASSTEYIGPFDTVLFKNNDNEIIAKVENASSHDYGFTTIEIDRAGSSGSELWSAGAENGIADKTLIITPTYNNPSGAYFFTLYLTQAEADGWMSYVNTNSAVRSIQDLNLAKTGGPLKNISPLDPNANGFTNYLATNNTVNETDGLILVRGYFDTGFSGIGAGAPGDPPSSPLPIELSYFKGYFANHIILKWQTYSEQQNDRFEIEKSYDGRSFETIGLVKGAIDSEAIIDYRFEDKSRLRKINYYRLKQVDLDGGYEYSKTIRVEAYIQHLSIYPNPAIDWLTIENARSEYFEIYDFMGREVRSGSILDVSQKIDLSGIPQGMYVLKMGDQSIKLIKE